MPKAQLGISFDRMNPRARAWAAEHAAKLVTQVSEETRAAIRDVIRMAFDEHLAPARSARLIRSLIGLTSRDANAVFAMRSALLENPGGIVWAGRKRIAVPEAVGEGFADDQADAYAERLMQSRAESIARTETIAASSEGQRQLWLQALDDGLLLGDEQRVWLKVPEVLKPCPICDALDGQAVGLDEPFESEDVGSVMGPPAHPNCRCAVGLARGRDAHARAAVGALGIPFVGGSPEYRREYARLRRQGLLGQRGAPAEPPVANPHEAKESSLRTTPVQSVARLGGGVSATHKVKLAEGIVGVFKPASGEPEGLRSNVKHGMQTQREVGAWEVAKAAGYDDLAAPTVARSVNAGAGAEAGSFQEWQEGTLARDMRGNTSYGSNEANVHRAAMFDYVTGNTDRHEGNWLVHNGKIRLIDHGLSFPEKAGAAGNTAFRDRARALHHGHGPDENFVAQREHVLPRVAKIEAAMRKAGLSDKSVAMFHKRVAHIKASKNWIEILEAERAARHQDPWRH